MIATVLLGLAAGNAWGGRLAEREFRERILARMFLLASVGVAACLWTPRLLSVAVQGPWASRVLLGCLLAFLAPALLLGTLGPLVLRAALTDPARDGRTAGRIYAAGTLGAVGASLLTGFVLIPVLGSTLLLIGVALALSLAAWALGRRSDVAWVVTLIVVGAFVAGPWEGAARIGRTLGLRPPASTHTEESRYFHIAVMPHPQRWVAVPAFDRLRSRLPLPTLQDRLAFDTPRGRLMWHGAMTPQERDHVRGVVGRANAAAADALYARTQHSMRRLALDGFVHGYADLTDPGWLEYDYERLYAALTNALRPRDRRLRLFFIGGGCYTMQRHLLHTRSAKLEVVTSEIDARVTAAARAHLGLADDARHIIVHDDARTVLRKTDIKFDIVYGDAFHDLAVPWHLTTQEFADVVRAHLAPDGVYLVNVIDVFTSGKFLRAFLDTIDEVFPYVRVLSIAPRQDDRQQTFVVAASGAELRWQKLIDATGRLLPVVEYEADDLAALRARTEPLVLRDAFAPVEHLLAPVVRKRGAVATRGSAR